jgi:hypothetical protein
LVTVVITVDVLFTVVVLVEGEGVTETLMVLPASELVLYTVAVDAGSVVLIVVVESAELVTVNVDCAAVATVLLETSLKLVTVVAEAEICWVELIVATL